MGPGSRRSKRPEAVLKIIQSFARETMLEHIAGNRCMDKEPVFRTQRDVRFSPCVTGKL